MMALELLNPMQRQAVLLTLVLAPLLAYLYLNVTSNNSQRETLLTSDRWLYNYSFSFGL